MNPNSVNNILKQTLTSDELPSATLIRQIKQESRQVSAQQKKKSHGSVSFRHFVSAAAVLLVIIGSTVLSGNLFGARDVLFSPANNPNPPLVAYAPAETAPELTPNTLPPRPNLADFIAPTLTVSEDPAATLPADADALSPEDAAQIGAKYIWAMFGESIDGTLVHMSYMHLEWSARSYWRGTVIDNVFYKPLLFEFEIDAVTGEWRSISNLAVLHYLMDKGGNPLLTQEEEHYRLTALRKTLTPEEIELYSSITSEFATRHFQNSSVFGFTIQKIAHPLTLARDENNTLIASAHTVFADFFDGAGTHFMQIHLCSDTLQLLQLFTYHEIAEGFVYGGAILPSDQELKAQMAGNWIWYDSNPDNASIVYLFADGSWQSPGPLPTDISIGGSFIIADVHSEGIYTLHLSIEHASDHPSSAYVEIGLVLQYQYDVLNDRLGMIRGNSRQITWFERTS